MTTLQVVLSVLCTLVAIWLLVLITRDRPADDVTLYGLALLETGLVLQLVLGLVRLFGPHDHVSVPTYVGYLFGALVILPIGFLWSAAERNRSGTAVLLVAVIALPVLFLRLHDIWEAGHV